MNNAALMFDANASVLYGTPSVTELVQTANVSVPVAAAAQPSVPWYQQELCASSPLTMPEPAVNTFAQRSRTERLESHGREFDAEWNRATDGRRNEYNSFGADGINNR